MEKVRHGAWRCKGWVLATFGGRKRAGRVSGFLTPRPFRAEGLSVFSRSPKHLSRVSHPVFNFSRKSSEPASLSLSKKKKKKKKKLNTLLFGWNFVNLDKTLASARTPSLNDRENRITFSA
ncbi:hypothetical protein ACRRTK_023900 [Alexandromys fortis]